MSKDQDDSYQAIPCADYSRYELWIMHGQNLQMAWRDADGQEHIGLLQPIDLQTRDRQEFLIAMPINRDDVLYIRLDRILSCKPDVA
jgi:transcriptional antiterminator Rof (Rho-off)